MKIKVCVVQEAPVFFDKKKTINKIERLVKKYSAKGAKLIVFPESYIPGYPRGFTFGTVVGKRSDLGKKLYAKYHEESLDLKSGELKRLEQVAKKTKTYLVIGCTEKNDRNGSLYCSMLYISPTKGLLGTHRKIKPTGTERLIWAESDGKDLVSFDTKIGKMGGLICWENYMPMARMAMYRQGIELYIAPTADGRESWVSSMQHIALEGRCFVIACNQHMTIEDYPPEYRSLIKLSKKDFCRGGSVIVAPTGKIIAGPLWDKAGHLHVEIDTKEIIKQKLDFDPIGHYDRPDIFSLEIKNQPPIRKE